MVITRFAPSPTGDLHIGGARTALYNWLYAEKTGGKFILRIEDTDLERSTEASIGVILEGLRWLGLGWDEGPYYQTRNFDRYHKVIEQLIETGHAYKCFCTKERLEKLRSDQMAAKVKPRYDGHCRNLTEDEQPDLPFVIRFKNPLEGEVVINDAVKGDIIISNKELDDLIIARTDGSPTYNLTVVVDDWDMGVTHVLRGDDHINNTPRQINILKALGAIPPVYGHMPMLLGSDGKRLSKRHGAVNVLSYQQEGILPQALINYIVRLGWSHGDQEIFTREEMIDKFDIKDINNSPAALNHEKLLWLNQQYFKLLPPNIVAVELASHMEVLGIHFENGPPLEEIVLAQAERCKTLVEMAEKSRYFYQDVTSYDEKAVAKNFTAETTHVLEMLHDKLASLPDWGDEPIHAAIEDVAQMLELKLGMVAQPLRIAVTGGTVSPPMNLTLRILGQTCTLQRIKQAIEFISKSC